MLEKELVQDKGKRYFSESSKQSNYKIILQNAIAPWSKNEGTNEIWNKIQS